MNNVAKSAIAGLVATGPMTIFMTSFYKRLPSKDKFPLPPRKITMTLAKEVGIKDKLNERQKFTLTIVNHFSYGALAGALFFPLTNFLGLPKYIGGISYGLLIWAGSYLGLLPLTNLHKPATKMSPTRNALMIGAHVVWGSTLGFLYDQLGRKQ